MEQQLTKTYFDEQFDILTRAVKGGFDHVDGELVGLKTDVAGLKTDVAGLKTDVVALKIDVADIQTRLRSMEDEVQTLSRTIITKQYLDQKIDQLLLLQQKDSLFKRMLLAALDQSKIIDPATRAKLEVLIPS